MNGNLFDSQVSYVKCAAQGSVLSSFVDKANATLNGLGNISGIPLVVTGLDVQSLSSVPFLSYNSTF